MHHNLKERKEQRRKKEESHVHVSKPLKLFSIFQAERLFFKAGEAVVCVYNMLPVCMICLFVSFSSFLSSSFNL